MKLIVEIDDEIYKTWRREGKYASHSYAQKIILNGTPLPKGHGRLKDVDWIDDNCETHCSDKDGSWCCAWRDIDNAPTIIEADKEDK